ncbi:hypothetical protein LEQ06_18425 [Paraclostridium sp. AKS46]|nr:hypothetical protein [Paraclostridium sp. AKS46]
MKKRKIMVAMAAITLVTSLSLGGNAFADEQTSIEANEQSTMQADEQSTMQPELRAGGGWYYATITLPRGGPWWATTTRTATVVNQGTGVNRPEYLVRARITTSNPDKVLAGPATHPAGADSVRWHYTNVKGSSVKAGFANSVGSLYTNKIALRWNP